MTDYRESNMYIWQVVRGCQFTILNGERHLIELDTPERVADEVFSFIDKCQKGFYREIIEK